MSGLPIDSCSSYTGRDRNNSYRYRYSDYTGSMLGQLSYFFTRALDNFPCYRWAASNCTNAWEIHNNTAAFPYSFSYTYPGKPPYYYNADPYEMSWQTAMGLQGYRQQYGFDGILANASVSIASKGIELDAGIANTKLKTVKTLSCYADSEDELKAEDGTDLKAKAKELIEKANAQIAQLKKIMENEEDLSVSEIREKVSVIYKTADGLYKEAETLSKKLKSAAEKVAEAKAAAAAATVDTGEGDGTGTTGGTGTGTGTGTGDGTGTTGGTGTGDGTGVDAPSQGQPPVVKTSPEKTDVETKGTKVKVKAKGGTEALAGKYYEYNGKIYKIVAAEAKPVDVTNDVEKITT